MAKKQTRRSISVSRNAYERLKAFCETSGISMSQFVESGIHDKLDDAGASPTTTTTTAAPPRPSTFAPARSQVAAQVDAPRPAAPVRPAPSPRPAPMLTSAAARYAVEPPPPIIKPRPVDHEPKAPAEPTPGQIFTF